MVYKDEPENFLQRSIVDLDSRFSNVRSISDKNELPIEKVEAKEVTKRWYFFFVDEQKYRTQNFELSCSQIMDIAGIPHQTGILQILEDGTQVQLAETDIVILKDSNCKFKKIPRFKRG